MTREPEEAVRVIIRRYYKTGNLESLVTDINAHYDYNKGLKGYLKRYV